MLPRLNYLVTLENYIAAMKELGIQRGHLENQFPTECTDAYARRDETSEFHQEKIQSHKTTWSLVHQANRAT